MKLYERIRTHISDRGMRISFVAKRSGIARSRLYRVLDGTSQMTAEEFEAICSRGLEVDPKCFFGDKVLDLKTSTGAIVQNNSA